MTRRVAGMGKADGNVGFGAPRDRDDAWAMRQQWCAAAGLAPDRLVTLGQVHGADVHVVAAGDAGTGRRARLAADRTRRCPGHERARARS